MIKAGIHRCYNNDRVANYAEKFCNEVVIRDFVENDETPLDCVVPVPPPVRRRGRIIACREPTNLVEHLGTGPREHGGQRSLAYAGSPGDHDDLRAGWAWVEECAAKKIK